MNKKYNKDLLIILLPIMVLFGKIIRWTILKSVLVDMSIGNGMISKVVNGTGWFTSLADTGVSDAAGNASIFFRIINIFGLTTTVQFEIYITILWNMLIIYLIIKSRKILNLSQFIFLITSIAVLNIWDFCLAKEPLQMAFFLIMALIIVNKKFNIKLKYFFTFLVLLITVLYYRVYYILIIAFLLIIPLVCKKWLLKLKKVRKKDVAFLLIFLAVVYFCMLNVIKIIDGESFNELIRVRTRTGVAATQMLNIFKSTNLFLFSLDYLIMIVRMLFPIELVPMGVKYWPYVFYQVLISFFLIKSILNIKQNSKSEDLALYLYMAFLLASATFEPDFGSWVRHEAAIFPVLLIMTKILEVKDKESGTFKNEEINN